ncbi:MAG: hypothetical protein ACRENU_16105 [Gemmatimonadaceae bacterium]
MTTAGRGIRVSLVATTIITAALGCARAPLQSPTPTPTPTPTAPEARSLSIRFENDAREHVHVYLIGETRQWLLGRVEPGAKATLRIPEESIGADWMFARLAVLTGEPVTLQAARHPRATLTVKQPAAAILSQRWYFANGGLAALGR